MYRPGGLAPVFDADEPEPTPDVPALPATPQLPSITQAMEAARQRHAMIPSADTEIIPTVEPKELVVREGIANIVLGDAGIVEADEKLGAIDPLVQ
jgi:hypothetical protein